MKFNFRLQTVLDVKEKLIKSVQKDLNDLLLQEQKGEVALTEIVEKIFSCETKIQEKNKFSPDVIQLYYDYYYELLDDRREIEFKLAELKNAINEKRLELMEKDREIKALESIKDKKREEFNHEVERQHQSLLDEIAVQKREHGVSLK